MAKYQIEEMPSFDPATHKTLALFVGASGTGKTRAATTWPRRTLFIDCDDGLLSVVDDIEGISRVRVPIEVKMKTTTIAGQQQGYPIVVDVVNALHDPKSDLYGKFATVVLDSMTSFGRAVLRYVLKLAGRTEPQIQDWGAQINLMEEVVLALRELRSMGTHIIVIAHDHADKDETDGRIMLRPNVTGKLASSLPMWFDEVWHFETKRDLKSKETLYFAQIRSGHNFHAKSRLDIAGNELFPVTYENYVTQMSARFAGRTPSGEKK